MRILFLSRWFPSPPNNGSKIRIFNILKQLARHHEVALLGFHESSDEVDPNAVGALGEYCADVRTVPYRAFRPSSAKARLGLLSIEPRSLVDTFSTELAEAVADVGRKRQYDLVVASQLAMVPYALTLRGVPALLEELELSVFRDAARREESPRRRLRSYLTWLKLCAYLRRALPRFAACTVVSETEKLNLQSAVPGYANVAVIPNAVDLAHYADPFGAARPDTLVFSGALTYAANYDAMCYFLHEVYPRIANAVPDLVLQITGNAAGVDLSALPGHPGVRYTGYVSDIRPVVAESWGSVVPLRLGGGTRLKILESLALGTPVVSTSKGAEGLAVADGENILIADDPSMFARRVVELLGSPGLRGQLATAGRDLVESTYNWDVVGRELRALVERLPARRAA